MLTYAYAYGPSLIHNAQGTPPPWILKRGGLESSGQRLMASNGKTNRIAFFLFLAKKLHF